MSNIQKTLDSLQPYVIGIRYLEGTALVDVFFKEGWTVIDDPTIKKIKGDEGLNYYMIFSESPNVGIDELLNYVSRVIKLNFEREKKHELLRVKVNELKEIFKKYNLAQLSRLSFTFGEEDLLPAISELDDEPEPTITNHKQEYIEEPIEVETFKEQPNNVDEGEISEEDREILEEEARAAKNLKILENQKKISSTKVIARKVELPPKPKIETTITQNEPISDCNCGPNEACDKCIDTKY
jgi:hypothetical protein